MIIGLISTIEDNSDRDFIFDLYTQYYGSMYNKALSLVDSPYTAEDMVQSTFIKLIENVDTLRTVSKYALYTYLTTALRNTTYNHLKSKTHQNAKVTLNLDDFVETQSDHLQTPLEDDIIIKITVEELSNAIVALPEKYRNVLYYKYLPDLNDDEIANELAIGKSSVRTYLTRARRKALELVERG